GDGTSLAEGGVHVAGEFLRTDAQQEQLADVVQQRLRLGRVQRLVPRQLEVGRLGGQSVDEGQEVGVLRRRQLVLCRCDRWHATGGDERVDVGIAVQADG